MFPFLNLALSGRSPDTGVLSQEGSITTYPEQVIHLLLTPSEHLALTLEGQPPGFSCPRNQLGDEDS